MKEDLKTDLTKSLINLVVKARAERKHGTPNDDVPNDIPNDADT